MNIWANPTKSKVTGVYSIKNSVNSHEYIGSSSEHIPKRWRLHRQMLEENRHHSAILQRAWNKYGAENFTFEILEECCKDNCIVREQHYLDTRNPIYNICKVAGSPRGRKFTASQKAAMRERVLGDKNPFFGKRHTPETRKKISAMVAGKMRGVLVGEKNPMYKRDHTEENKRVMSEKSVEFWNSAVGMKMRKRRSKELRGKSNKFAPKGSAHPKYNPAIHTFYNDTLNETYVGTMFDFRKKYKLCGDVYYLLHGKQKQYKQYRGWKVITQ